MLLDYENQMIIDMYNSDSLLVTGKGMGLDKIFYSFLKLYSVENVLVLVLNCTMEESKFFINNLKSDGVPVLPSLVSSESSTKSHENVYNKGGVVFASSRILIVDYLMNRIPGRLVTGALVYRGHKILEAGQEAFVLRLVKERNNDAFVKAFSENPISLSSGFNVLDRVMMSLQVRNVYLWPRFALSVVDTLNKCKPLIEEIHSNLTTMGTTCQMAILEIIKDLLNELKLQNPVINNDELTVESAISTVFDRVVRVYFDGVWNQISKSSRQLIGEIKELRRLLHFLIEEDSASFYNLLETMRISALANKSSWIASKSANVLMTSAKARLRSDPKFNLKNIKNVKELNIEVPPKWKEFEDLVKTVESQLKLNDKIFVVVNTELMAEHLCSIIVDGCEKTARRIAKVELKLKGPIRSKKKDSEQCYTKEDSCLILKNRNSLVIHYMSQDYESKYTPNSKFHYLLRKWLPTYIILFDPRMLCVREIENYQGELIGSSNSDNVRIVRVYFMMYSNSVEEQKYLTILRKEKEAFQYLINAKAHLVLPTYVYDRNINVYGRSDAINRAVPFTSTRIGGGDDNAPEAKIIVDMREFRSDLPSLLYRRGFEVDPLTISVGDYVLAPHICVERKSVSDFIGSLCNGRLYNQCCGMTRNYPLSVLLIEFCSTATASKSELKTFSLFIGKNQISNEINCKDILAKLALLIIHFPKLRILWSESPYATVEMFIDLKMGRPEPNTDKILNVDSLYSDENKYDESVVDILLKIPGITWKNHGYFLKRITNLLDLLKYSEEELAGFLENKSAAKSIYSFLHGSKKEYFDLDNLETISKYSKRPRFDLLKKVKK